MLVFFPDSFKNLEVQLDASTESAFGALSGLGFQAFLLKMHPGLDYLAVLRCDTPERPPDGLIERAADMVPKANRSARVVRSMLWIIPCFISTLGGFLIGLSFDTFATTDLIHTFLG
ncbi:MAG TPA: hypothetical protein VJH97_02430 [Candidatus Nanoarchaeia archaeon]|nr:hypothetical protein [Candidatus Nanoarchaeia archaeon]